MNLHVASSPHSSTASLHLPPPHCYCQICCMSKCRPNSRIMCILFVTLLWKIIRKKEGIMHCKGFYNCIITFAGRLFSHAHLTRNYCLVTCFKSLQNFLQDVPQGSVLTADPWGSVGWSGLVSVSPPSLKVSFAE